MVICVFILAVEGCGARIAHSERTIKMLFLTRPFQTIFGFLGSGKEKKYIINSIKKKIKSKTEERNGQRIYHRKPMAYYSKTSWNQSQNDETEKGEEETQAKSHGQDEGKSFDFFLTLEKERKKFFQKMAKYGESIEDFTEQEVVSEVEQKLERHGIFQEDLLEMAEIVKEDNGSWALSEPIGPPKSNAIIPVGPPKKKK